LPTAIAFENLNRIENQYTAPDWYENNETKEMKWFDGEGEHEGYTHKGGGLKDAAVVIGDGNIVNTQKGKERAGDIMEGTMILVGVLSADDLTVYGAIDDVIIPFVLSVGTMSALCTYVYYDQFAHTPKKQSSGK